jgi:hypothetical protein
MTKELEEMLSHTWTLRNTLKMSLAPELVDHIMSLIVQDNARRKLEAFMEAPEETNN